MRKAMPYLGAALSALALSWTVSASAQDGQFKDLQQDHWAYQAVNDLQQKGILEGYPDGFFRGKRTLTRYEFAIAIKRLLDKLPGMLPPGPAGPAGPPGPAGTAGEGGPAGNFATKEDLDTIRGLVTRFEGDLRALGTDVTAVKARLDAAEKDIADIKSQLSKMIKFNGSLGVFVRTDLSRNLFVDYGGAIRNPGTLLGNANVSHDFHLGMTAPVNGDGKFIGDIVASNYLGGYRGNTLSVASIAQSQTGSGSLANNETFFLRRAELQLPVKVGKNGLLKLGRYLFQITPGIYQRPDLDPYFDTEYDDGNFSQDGALLRLGIGSLNTEFFAASFASVTGINTNGNGVNNPINSPLVGSNTGFPVFFGKPFGINPTGQNVTATQVAGVTVKAPFFNLGEIGVTGATFGTDSAVTGTSNLTLFGAYIKPKPFGRINILAEAAKTINGSKLSRIGESAGEPSGNEDNTYFNLKLGYASGPLDISGGYIYVDPRYSAPGNWLKIGNWYNPTNVRGPYADINYKVSKGVNINLGGNWLEGARNRTINVAGGANVANGLNIGDDIYRVKAGISYAFNPRVSLGVDYEGVLYDLSARTSGTNNRTKPIEQYITISTGLHIAGNTMLKLGYQLINFQNVGGGFSNGNQGVTGVAGVGSTGNSYNANSLTAQLQVKF